METETVETETVATGPPVTEIAETEIAATETAGTATTDRTTEKTCEQVEVETLKTAGKGVTVVLTDEMIVGLTTEGKTHHRKV